MEKDPSTGKAVSWRSVTACETTLGTDDGDRTTGDSQRDHELTPMHVSLPDQAADARGRTESLLSIVGAGDSLVTDDHHDPLALVKVNAQACRRIAASIAAKPIPEDREDVSLTHIPARSRGEFLPFSGCNLATRRPDWEAGPPGPVHGRCALAGTISLLVSKSERQQTLLCSSPAAGVR